MVELRIARKLWPARRLLARPTSRFRPALPCITVGPLLCFRLNKHTGLKGAVNGVEQVGRARERLLSIRMKQRRK